MIALWDLLSKLFIYDWIHCLIQRVQIPMYLSALGRKSGLAKMSKSENQKTTFPDDTERILFAAWELKLLLWAHVCVRGIQGLPEEIFLH